MREIVPRADRCHNVTLGVKKSKIYAEVTCERSLVAALHLGDALQHGAEVAHAPLEVGEELQADGRHDGDGVQRQVLLMEPLEAVALHLHI